MRQEPWVERAGSNVGGWVLAQVQPRAEHAVVEHPLTATLRVGAQPAEATVEVDGRPMGPAGHDIVVLLKETAEKKVTVRVEEEGYLPREAEVTLARGKVSEWPDVKLDPLPGSSSGRPREANAARTPDPGEPAAAGEHLFRRGQL